MPKITGIVIPADVDVPISTIEFERGDITAIQQVVDGTFDVIDTASHGASIWIHDEGKLIGRPFNLRAALYLWLDSVWRQQDVLLGAVLFTGHPDRDGNTTDAPEELMTLLFQTDRCRM